MLSFLCSLPDPLIFTDNEDQKNVPSRVIYRCKETICMTWKEKRELENLGGKLWKLLNATIAGIWTSFRGQ